MRLMKIKNKNKTKLSQEDSGNSASVESSTISKRMLRVLTYVVILALLILTYIIVSNYDTSNYINEVIPEKVREHKWSTIFSDKNNTRTEKFLIYDFKNDGIFSQFLRLKLVYNFSRTFNRTLIIPPNQNER